MRGGSGFGGVVAFLLCGLVAVPPLSAQRLDGAALDATVRAQLPGALALYRDLLRLPNDANHPGDILRLVTWLEAAFAERGFTTARLETAGSPLLLAERRAPGAERTVLVYLQADGQPVDPAAWDQDSPWEPVVKARFEDGWRALEWGRLEAMARVRGPGPVGTALDPEWRIFARSASDSKGPVAQFLAALDVAASAGVTPDFNLRVVVDTEEELGSPNLAAAVARHRDRLAADMLVIFDGPPHASGRPTLTFGARGIATATLTVFGPRVPQHSGHYGNWVPNPALGLAEILASLKGPDGRVAVDGWYDGVVLTPEVRAVLADVPDDPAELGRALGVAAFEGVAPTLQEALQYPSLNVRGLRSGWVGSEARTIIPAEAVAELDIRLVVESDGERLLELLRRHVAGQGWHLVEGAEPTEEERARHPRLARLSGRVSYGAFRTAYDAVPGVWLTRALTRLNGSAPLRVRTFGGSIPIAPFVSTLAVPAVVVATVNPDNNQHSPNENLRLGDFVAGIRTMVAVLQEPLPEGTGGEGQGPPAGPRPPS